eukprot:m.87419 g.87419  ORF g.87419 m.87419 type:complete len:87 (+) comp13107_c0_seq3:258-518(+)
MLISTCRTTIPSHYFQIHQIHMTSGGVFLKSILIPRLVIKVKPMLELIRGVDEGPDHVAIGYLPFYATEPILLFLVLRYSPECQGL